MAFRLVASLRQARLAVALLHKVGPRASCRLPGLRSKRKKSENITSFAPMVWRRYPVYVGPLANWQSSERAQSSSSDSRSSTKAKGPKAMLTTEMTEQVRQAQAGGLERPAPGQGRPSSGAVEARDALWLYELTQGATVVQIARRSHLSCRQVQLGVARARKREQARLQVSRKQECRTRDIFQVRNQTLPPGAHKGEVAWEDPHRSPRLIPLFPIGPFTPGSACPHHGPIRSGSVFCCMVCSQSGMDGHPALKRDPRTDPRPEPKPAARVKISARETRKERRRRLRETRQSSSPLLPSP